MAQPYQFTTDPQVILRVADQAHIPDDPANIDYQEFLAWDAIPGNDPDPAPPLPEVVPVPDANLRLDNGVAASVDAWNAVTIPAEDARATTDTKQDARLQRLEDALRALCNGHMADTGTPAFD
jgi:hypothetical protein